MNLENWIIALGLVISIVPVVKMVKSKKFYGYNIFLVSAGILILCLTIYKNNNDEARIKLDKKKSAISDSIYRAALAQLNEKVTGSQQTLARVKVLLDSIGLKFDENSNNLINTKKKVKQSHTLIFLI